MSEWEEFTTEWKNWQWFRFMFLVLAVGIPLVLCEKILGRQPVWLVDWLDNKLK